MLVINVVEDIMNKLTVLDNLISASQTVGLDKNYLVLITSFGVVTGKFYRVQKNKKDEIINKENVFDAICTIIKDEDAKTIANSNEEVKKDSIILKDVMLEYPSGKTQYFAYLFVFIDQIVAATLSAVDKPEQANH